MYLATRRGRQVPWSWNYEWLWASRCGSWEANFYPLEAVLTTAACLAPIDRNFILLLDYLFLVIQNPISYASFSWWLLDVLWELGKFVLLLNYRRLYLDYFYNVIVLLLGTDSHDSQAALLQLTVHLRMTLKSRPYLCPLSARVTSGCHMPGFCGSGDPVQDFVHDRQALWPLSRISGPSFMFTSESPVPSGGLLVSSMKKGGSRFWVHVASF